MNRNQLKAFFLSTTFLFYGLLPFEKAAANTIYVNCELKGLVSRNSRKKCLANEYLSENVPNYAKDVAPHVIDEVRFADFIRKYKEQRDFSEQEKLEAIVQLGIYKYAPKWLKPETKAKIDKMMLKADAGQMAVLLSNPVKIAMAERINSVNRISAINDTYVDGWQISNAITLPLNSSALLFSAITPELIAAVSLAVGLGTIFASGVAVGYVGYYVTDYAIKQISEAIDDYCHKHQCITIEPKPEIIPKVIEGGNGTLNDYDNECWRTLHECEYSKSLFIHNNDCGECYRACRGNESHGMTNPWPEGIKACKSKKYVPLPPSYFH